MDSTGSQWTTVINHPTVFLLFAKDDDGNVYVLDEYLRAGAFPQEHAAAVKAMLERNNVDETPLLDPRAGPDVFSRHTKRTIADRYADEGLYLKPAVTDRIQGANEIRTRLGDPERGLQPSLFITTNCSRLIECLTELQHDPANPEDVLKTNVNQYGQGGDDTYDALRYGLMSIPPPFIARSPQQSPGLRTRGLRLGRLPQRQIRRRPHPAHGSRSA